MSKRFKTVTVVCPHTGHERDVSPRWAAAITGRSTRTAQRWAAGGRMDTAARALLAMRVFGVLPGDEWRHFRLRGGMLENIETGETWTPLQLRAVWITNQQLMEFQRQASKEKRRLFAVN